MTHLIKQCGAPALPQSGLLEPVSPGDSQGRRNFDKPREIEQQPSLIKSVEALAAPGFQRSAKKT
ncbi:MAG: hypothetical protein SWH61_17050 [Thermodesulfobacteriota bacterium]|nr:hypothetical protein [Thermodesulfobacteriota bacterium]